MKEDRSQFHGSESTFRRKEKCYPKNSCQLSKSQIWKEGRSLIALAKESAMIVFISSCGNAVSWMVEELPEIRMQNSRPCSRRELLQDCQGTIYKGTIFHAMRKLIPISAYFLFTLNEWPAIKTSAFFCRLNSWMDIWSPLYVPTCILTAVG